MRGRTPVSNFVTIVSFMVVWPLASGGVIAALSLAVVASMPEALRQIDAPGPSPWAAGLLVGALAYSPPAAVTGLIMSILSRRIRTGRGWMGYSALSGAALTSAALLVMFRSIFTEGPLGAGLYVVAGLTLCGVIGALVAAAATLGLRPRPPLPEMTERAA